jgi:hypothetical protein
LVNPEASIDTELQTGFAIASQVGLICPLAIGVKSRIKRVKTTKDMRNIKF